MNTREQYTEAWRIRRLAARSMMDINRNTPTAKMFRFLAESDEFRRRAEELSPAACDSYKARVRAEGPAR